MHERIPNVATRDRHQEGWDGCLDRLSNYFESRGKDSVAAYNISTQRQLRVSPNHNAVAIEHGERLKSCRHAA